MNTSNQSAAGQQDKANTSSSGKLRSDSSEKISQNQNLDADKSSVNQKLSDASTNSQRDDFQSNTTSAIQAERLDQAGNQNYTESKKSATFQEPARSAQKQRRLPEQLKAKVQAAWPKMTLF